MDKKTKLSQSKPGWIFQRRNGLGPETLYISEDGVLLKYPTAQLSVVCKKPDWNIARFNTRTKRILRESIDQFRIRKGMPVAEKQLSRNRLVPCKYAGLDALTIAARSTERNEPDVAALPAIGKLRNGKPIAANYYFSKPMPLPTQALKFLNTFFGVPATGGVPLGCEEQLSDGSTERLWITLSGERSRIANSLFEVPAGLKAVKSQHDLDDAGGYTSAMEDLMKGMGVGERLGH